MMTVMRFVYENYDQAKGKQTESEDAIQQAVNWAVLCIESNDGMRRLMT